MRYKFIILALLLILSFSAKIVFADTTSNLIGYYSFDDGTASDQSGNSRNGTITGATPVTGKIGQALSFNGTSYVSVSGIPGSATMTYSAWIKANSIANSESVLSHSIFRALNFYVGNPHKVAFTVNASYWAGAIAPTAVDDGAWHLITGTTDGTNSKIYIDGNLASSVSLAANTSPGTFYIGGDSDTSGIGNFVGAIDDVRVYSRALSAADVSELYAAASGGGTSPTPVNGSCSTTVNMCTAGTFLDQTDSQTQALWQCTGSNGGTTASCSSAITQNPTPVNGVCGASTNSCTAGNFLDQTDSQTQNLWQCTGTSGGTTASCNSAITQTQPTGSNIYIAQNQSGTGDASSCANAKSVSYLGTASNWAPGKIFHLCGVISSTISVLGSGASGNPITIYFEPNAKISMPASTLINMTGAKYIVVDGGTNGILENTDNGTNLGHKVATSGIYASGASDIEVKNLTVQNLYIHTSVSDGTGDFAAQGAFYSNGNGSNISIHDNVFKEICWMITLFPAAGASNINIYNNSFTNYDHAIAGLGGSPASPSNINIYNNHFGSTANWDTTANSYHHDGIHVFFGSGGVSGIKIYNNTFDGDWGVNNTAHIFLEGNYNRPPVSGITNMSITNNVFIQNPNNLLNNGFISGFGDNSTYSNNTFIGSGVPLSFCVVMAGSNFTFKNNIISGCNQFMQFVSGSLASGGVSNNLYANVVPSGNSPWSYLGQAITSLASWKSATGQDSTSQQIANATFSADGHLLTSIQMTNIGAYPYSGGGGSNPPPIVGDFNNDGAVNSIDLSLMAGAWNTTNATYDLNGDGRVNTLDYVLMVKNWTN